MVLIRYRNRNEPLSETLVCAVVAADGFAEAWEILSGSWREAHPGSADLPPKEDDFDVDIIGGAAGHIERGVICMDFIEP